MVHMDDEPNGPQPGSNIKLVPCNRQEINGRCMQDELDQSEMNAGSMEKGN